MRRTQREADGTPRRRVSDSEKNRRTTHCWTAADPSLPFDWLDDSIIDRGSSFFFVCICVCLCVCVSASVCVSEIKNDETGTARSRGLSIAGDAIDRSDIGMGGGGEEKRQATN